MSRLLNKQLRNLRRQQDTSADDQQSRQDQKREEQRRRNVQQQSVSNLSRRLDRLGVVANPPVLGRWNSLAQNFGRTRSFAGLLRDFDKLGVVGPAGTLGKWANLGRNFAPTRSLGGLAQDIDRLGLFAKPGSFGPLAALAGNFGRSRTIGEFINRASPLLTSTARVAAPMVGTAIGGPPGAMAVQMLARLLGQSEAEFESEFEFEDEADSFREAELEIWNHELTAREALAEAMAEAVQHHQNEAEAETMMGAAALTVISPADRRELRGVLPHLLHGTAILTRILRARRGTRPAVRVVPTITRRTVRALRKKVAAGVPITRRLAAETEAREIRKVLSSPVACAAAMANNVRANGCYAQWPDRQVDEVRV
jgi:hypothetical protein